MSAKAVIVTPDKAMNFTEANYRKSLEELKNQTRREAKLPVKVRLPRDVQGDWPIGHKCIARAGVHVADLNPRGAVSVMGENGELLGIRPAEMEWVARYSVGDIVALRTAWAVHQRYDGLAPLDFPKRAQKSIWFVSDGSKPDWSGKLRPAMFLPKVMWHLCRTAVITSVRLEPLKKISESDCIAEGVIKLPATGRCVLHQGGQYLGQVWDRAIDAYADLWDSINGRGAFDANPFVWVYGYKLRKEQR